MGMGKICTLQIGDVLVYTEALLLLCNYIDLNVTRLDTSP